MSSTDKVNDGQGLNTPVVSVEAAASEAVTKVITPNTLPLASTAQLEAVMRQNPFDATFRNAAAQMGSSTAKAPTPTSAQLSVMFENVPGQSPVQFASAYNTSPADENADPSAAALINHFNSQQKQGASGDDSVETPDIIRKALLGTQLLPASTASSTTPQTADIVQRLLEIQRDDASTNQTPQIEISQLATLTSQSPEKVKSEPASTPEIASGSSTSEPQPLMLSVKLGDQQVQVPLRVAVTQTTVGHNQVRITTSSNSHYGNQLLQPPPVESAGPSSRESSMSPTPRRGYARVQRRVWHCDNCRRSTRSHTPIDGERRRDVLERNREAAVRYRKRKRQEQEKLSERVDVLEKERLELKARNNVLQRELDTVNAQLRHYQQCCTCNARSTAANVQMPPERHTTVSSHSTRRTILPNMQ